MARPAEGRRAASRCGVLLAASTGRALLLAAVLAGCGDARPRPRVASECPSWQAARAEQAIGPQLQAACGGCHGGATPAAGYDVSSYQGAIGVGASGGQIALPGDASSRLLKALDPATANATHAPLSKLLPQLTEWVVACKLPYGPQGVHPPGILDPLDDDFHGKLARARSYDFAYCAKCHGDDLAGGKAGKSCLGCHKDGPTGCTTCHDYPPRSGAHAVHLEGTALSRKLACEECHLVPQKWTDVGHVFRADGTLEPRGARVIFGSLAALSIAPDHRTGPPSYDPATRTCTNVYCHGGTFDDSAATARSPVWSDAAPTGRCDGCHGSGPSSHRSTRCVDCHARAIDEAGKLRGLERHIDGRISLGDEQGSCSSCHGGATSPAPPSVLAGTPAAEASIIIGAHAVHGLAGGPLGLSGSLGCGACHLVPQALDDVGHLDSAPPAEVFPAAAAAAGSLAFADGATPRWDRGAATCAGVYCHGGGTHLGKDAARTLHQVPSWTGDLAEARCGACHGIPPTTAIDDQGTRHPDVGLDRCAQCHPNTVDGFGMILVTGPPGARVSRHINGRVDTP